MKYTFQEKPESQKGIISNTHGFLNRDLDTGFGSKWSGFWTPPYKLLDYFAFRVNGIWLNQATLKGIEYGDEMIFHHETDSLSIKEVIRFPEEFPGFKVSLEIENKSSERKAVHSTMETGIDIRRKDEDTNSEQYDYERKEKQLRASRKGREIIIESKDIQGFSGDRYEKEHFPGERQVCMVPEKPVFQDEVEGGDSTRIEVKFKTSNSSLLELESPDNHLEHDLGRLFSCSLDSLENMIYQSNGAGIIAGHPWFQSYWARDSFWSLLGLIDGGYFEISERVLENFADRDLDGKIELDENREEVITRSDTAPLFVIAADKLRRHHGISSEIEEVMKDAMEKLDLDGEIVGHDPEGTWMDTLERKEAIDIQSLWLEAARIMDDDRADKLEAGLERFEEKGLLKDELDGGADSVNTSIPLMLGHLEAEKELEKINGEFSSSYGARTRSVTDPGYESGGYHTGSVWGLTTCWVAAANFRSGKDRQGTNFLQKMDKLLDRDQPGALPEVVNAESGELLGATEQAWSAGMAVHVIDSYMLGIEVEDDHVKIEPAEVTCERRGKKIRGEELDLKVVDGEVQILNDPDLDLRF